MRRFAVLYGQPAYFDIPFDSGRLMIGADVDAGTTLAIAGVPVAGPLLWTLINDEDDAALARRAFSRAKNSATVLPDRAAVHGWDTC